MVETGEIIFFLNGIWYKQIIIYLLPLLPVKKRSVLSNRHSNKRLRGLSAVILDDKKEVRERVKDFLAENCPEIQVVGEAASMEEAEQLMFDLKPNILFQDLPMPMGKKREWIRELTKRIKVVIASGEADYGMGWPGPVLAEEVMKYLAIDKRTEESRLPVTAQGFPLAMGTRNHPARIAVPVHGGLEMLRISEMVFIESDNSYCTVHTTNKKLLVCKGIGDFEKILRESGFFRIHNSFLVNLNYVHSFSNLDGPSLKLASGNVLPVAKRRYKDLKEIFLSIYKHFD